MTEREWKSFEEQSEVANEFLAMAELSAKNGDKVGAFGYKELALSVLGMAYETSLGRFAA
jgi:hypothetical protein